MTKIISFYNLIGVLCKMDAEKDNFTSSEEGKQNLVSNTDKFVKFKEDTILVFNYVANQKYPEGMSRDQKKVFRRKCKCYTIKDGVLYYVGFGKKEVELDLHLKNTSPAVLDSKIIFTAELDVTPHGDVRAAIYKYVWIDSASSKNVTITYGNGTSQLTRLYAVHSMPEYKIGMYTMKVEVYQKVDISLEDWVKNQTPLAKGTMSFNLTDSLNVSALLNQSLQIMSPEGVFATNEVLSINPGIHEIFSTVDYKYDLYTNGSRNYTGNAPVIYISYTHTGETNLSVRVIANITIAEAGWPVETHVREGWANLTIKLKESVNHIKYLGESQYLIGEEVSATFVCRGSPPFFFSFGMSGNIKPHGDILPVSDLSGNWRPGNRAAVITPVKSDRKPVCVAKFVHIFNETGGFTVYVEVQNEVGLQKTQVTLNVVYPDEPMPPAAIAMCVVIAIFCFVLITVVYLREQGSILQTPTEETANHYFYFSPGEGTSDTPSSPTIRKVTRPRYIKEGLSIMYSTTKNWVVSLASSHSSQTSGLSYDEL